MPVNERLKNTIRSIKFTSKLNQSEIAEKLDVKSTYLSDMINGRVPFTINMKEKIHEVFSYNMDEGSNVDLKEPKIFYGGELDKKPNLIPFYDNVASIGGINELGSEMSGVTQPTEYIDAGDWFRDATAAIRHYGDSMVEYPPGSILAIKEVYDRKLIVPGRDYIIETSEFRITKRVQRGANDEHITAYSTNPETYPDGRMVHEPFDIYWDTIDRISLVLGYVVKKNGGTMVFNNQKV